MKQEFRVWPVLIVAVLTISATVVLAILVTRAAGDWVIKQPTPYHDPEADLD